MNSDRNDQRGNVKCLMIIVGWSLSLIVSGSVTRGSLTSTFKPDLMAHAKTVERTKAQKTSLI